MQQWTYEWQTIRECTVMVMFFSSHNSTVPCENYWRQYNTTESFKRCRPWLESPFKIRRSAFAEINIEYMLKITATVVTRTDHLTSEKQMYSAYW